MRLWIGLGTGLLCLGACMSRPTATPGLNSTEAGAPTTVANAASSAGQPTVQFARNATVGSMWAAACASCHGGNGEGSSGVKSLISRELYDQKYDRPFFDAVKNGTPCKVPANVRQGLTDVQIWGLIVRVREMQGRTLRSREGSLRPDAAGVYKTQRASYRVEEVVPEGPLRTPWGIDWLPDGTMLVTNRPGTLVAVRNGQVSTIANTPAVTEMGQGGLMDVAVHPDYARNGWIYLSYTEGRNGGGMTKLVRGKLARAANGALSWTGQQVLWQPGPDQYPRSGVHFGSRIVLDGGYLFLVQGERAVTNQVQDITTPYGKIFRMFDDGRIPPDNPFAGQGGSAPLVWSYGHRNPQGLVKGLDGRMWSTEHLPRGGDELNEVVKGANYGWPVVAFSINYNDVPEWTPWPTPAQNIRMPIYRWLPSSGACGLDVVRGAAFPAWQGDLVAGGLVGNNLDRIRTKDGKLVEREEILHGMGRIRDVSVSKDGAIYLALNGPDKVVRLVPAR